MPNRQHRPCELIASIKGVERAFGPGGEFAQQENEIEISQLLREANERLVLSAIVAQELAEAAKQAEALFESLPDVIARFDRGLRYIYVNIAIEGVTGRHRAEFLGKTNESLGIFGELASRCNALVAGAFATGVQVESSFEVAAAGGARHFNVRAVPECTGDGPVGSVVTITRDVTESRMYQSAREDADRLRRLQASTAAFSKASTPADVADVLVAEVKDALEADAGVVLLLDREGNHLELAAVVGDPCAGAQAFRVVPVDADAPLAESVRMRVPLFFESRDALVERYPSLGAAGYPSDDALVVVPLDWEEKAYGALGLIFRKPRLFRPADRDFVVSMANHAGQAIDRARLLEAERHARLEAEAASRLKDEFLATVSHELRTPLNAVLGWSSILVARAPSEPAIRRAADVIDRNARAQAKLVEDLLDISRIISGRLPLEIDDVDVGSLVSAAADLVGPAAEAKTINIDIAFEALCVIRADAGRLRQVIWNLLSNAVKFTPDRGKIDISVQRVAEHVAIEVRDTGIGITPKFLPHVFERFRQEDASTTRRHGGLGLGLAIVRHLVELHGGTVVAKSDGIGLGATFTVRLPVHSTSDRSAQPLGGPPRSNPAVAAPPPNLSGLRILLVDDDRDSCELLGSALKDCGAAVTSAEGADEGIERLIAGPPDVVVCDIGMPGVDGYEFMRNVRRLSQSAGGRTPAIALTGYAREEDRRLAFAAGFQLHFAKPVDLCGLSHAVANLGGRTLHV